MKTQVSLVVFEGGLVSGKLEEQMQMVRQAMVLDLIRQARLGGFSQIIVVTSSASFRNKLAKNGVEVVLDSGKEEPFHLGRNLLAVIKDYGLEKVLYMGGAAAPLISSSELKYLREVLEQNDNILLANNYYSADIVGFCPGKVLEKVVLPAIDNTLPLALSAQKKLRWVPIPKSLGLNFDVDTPTDVLIMSVHPEIGENTKAAVTELDWDFQRYTAIKGLLFDPCSELLVAGRVGSNFFQYLDANTKCRIRLFSEERGMKALGRDLQGEVRSLTGKLAEELGFTGFFDFLGEIAQGAVLDTRVLFEHFRWRLSAADRFASDLGKVELITHPQLAEFTKAALEAPIPILLGGHSLVTGGLWALIDGGLKKSGQG